MRSGAGLGCPTSEIIFRRVGRPPRERHLPLRAADSCRHRARCDEASVAAGGAAIAELLQQLQFGYKAGALGVALN